VPEQERARRRSEERRRMSGSTQQKSGPWKEWGPYLAERAWGTVREDYSADGDAWAYFPHDQARSRAYRWNEDGLAGICDLRQRLCLALAVWNGRDPILKERAFGLTNSEGNHGEDVKEYWWYLDSTPSHSWMTWRYHYPQQPFPYERLLEENAKRTHDDPEFELLDTGIFDEDRYWAITVDYAKASPRDICMRISVTNHGPDPDTIHILPTLWFRNTWAWGYDPSRPALSAVAGNVTITQNDSGAWLLEPAADPEGNAPQLLFCDNDTNTARLFGASDSPAYPKDGINDHVVNGEPTVNPGQAGTKAAAWYQLAIAPGETAELRLRLRDATEDNAPFDQVIAERKQEADDYYDSLTPSGTSADEAAVLRQAAAGLLWSKQFYHYDVADWLSGDPAEPVPPAERLHGRNSGWQHLDNNDVLSMPDKWEYPWYASWDLAFHCVALAHLDPELAKHQLTLLCREWYMHPNGQLPAYEWNFSDVNPPVHAWAALRVFEVDGGCDHEFLERIFHKLLINFTWWVNREDAEGNNAFQGGFLGLDNIGPFDRTSTKLPVDGHLEQSDGTAWMAMYCLNLLEMAQRLSRHDETYEDVAVKFFEHFAYISTALNNQGLWDEQDGFYYDVLSRPDGTTLPLRARSMVGLIPMFAVTAFDADVTTQMPDFIQRAHWFIDHKPALTRSVAHVRQDPEGVNHLLSVPTPEQLTRILARVLDESEFLSPYGIRSLSAYHRDHPLNEDLGNGVKAYLDYEPAESRTGMFGGNSNWRGPVWFPVNYLAIEALRRYDKCLGDDFTVELPTGSGTKVNLAEVAENLRRRLIALFLDDDQHRRPAFGPAAKFQHDPNWHNLHQFNEYFHGDTGAGLGASHQTGWTALVLDLILESRRP
jgi:Glycosyl hydrolase family 63 C-terminal domain